MSTPKRLGKYRAFEATIELLLDYQVYFVAPSMFNDQLDSRPTMKQYTDAFDTADGLVPRRFQKARRLLWDECGHTWSMQSMETIRRAIPLLISGYQGTGKSSTAARFNASAEIIDAEWLQAETARTIDPETPNPYEWDFWSGDRVLQLPGQLNRVFKKRYGTKSAAQRFLVLEAAILVKDWYLVALIGVLHLNRPDLLWSSAEFLVLDFDPALIHERIQLRAVQERPLERSITLEEVQLRATGYRDSHAKKSMFPWQFLASPIELEKSVRRIVGESPEVKKD